MHVFPTSDQAWWKVTKTSYGTVATVPNPCTADGECAIEVLDLATVSGEYSFEISAVSVIGNSLESNTITRQATAGSGVVGQTCTGYSQPPAPVITEHTVADSVLHLEWTHPGVADYTDANGDTNPVPVQYRLVMKPAKGIATTSTFISTKLDTDIALYNIGDYTYYLYATNCINGPSSEEITTTLEAPAPPTNVTGIQTGGSVTVSWTPPAAGSSNSAITGYSVMLTQPTGAPLLRQVADPLEVSYTFPEALLAGEYTVSVGSYYGSGTASSFSNSSMIPAQDPVFIGRPAPVTPGAANIFGDSLFVSWKAPDETGGGALLGYRIVVQSPNSAETEATRTIAVDGTINGGGAGESLSIINGYYIWQYPATARGLYRVMVSAYSAAGNGPAVELSASEVLQAPSAVEGLDLTIDNGVARVSWLAPQNPGAKPVKGYRVMLKPQTSAVNAVPPSGPIPTISTTVAVGLVGELTGGIVNATLADGRYTLLTPISTSEAVTVDVYAYSDAGNGQVASKTFGTVLPDPPRIVSIGVSAGMVRVSWLAPESSGTHPVSGYALALYLPSGAIVTKNLTSTAATTTNPNLGGGVTLADIDGDLTYTWSNNIVTAGDYRAEVIAKTGAGQSDTAVALTSPEAATVPGKVTALDLGYSNTASKITATWGQPSNNGGLPLGSYQVTWYSPKSAPVTVTVPAAQTFADFATTQPGTHTVTVRAVTAAGNGLVRAKNIKLSGTPSQFGGGSDSEDVIVQMNLAGEYEELRFGEQENITFKFINAGLTSAPEEWIFTYPREITPVSSPDCSISGQKVTCLIGSIPQGIPQSEALVMATVLSAPSSSAVHDQTYRITADNGYWFEVRTFDGYALQKQLGAEGRVEVDSGRVTYFAKGTVPVALVESEQALSSFVAECSTGQPFTTSDPLEISMWGISKVTGGLVLIPKKTAQFWGQALPTMFDVYGYQTADTGCRQLVTATSSVANWSLVGAVASTGWDLHVVSSDLLASAFQNKLDEAQQSNSCLKVDGRLGIHGAAVPAWETWTSETVDGYSLTCQ